MYHHCWQQAIRVAEAKGRLGIGRVSDDAGHSHLGTGKWIAMADEAQRTLGLACGQCRLCDALVSPRLGGARPGDGHIRRRGSATVTGDGKSDGKMETMRSRRISINGLRFLPNIEWKRVSPCFSTMASNLSAMPLGRLVPPPTSVRWTR